MAGCSKDVEPSSPDPDAWKYDVTLPVPIEFGTPNILTKADRIASTTGTFGVFAISKTADDLNIVARPGDGRERLLYNQKANYSNGVFALAQTAYYPMNNELNYNFYSYWQYQGTTSLEPVIEEKRIYVPLNIGVDNYDILYGNSKVTKAMRNEAGEGYNARYIRKVRSLEAADATTETYTHFNPQINFRHVTSSLEFNVTTTDEGAVYFAANPVYVSNITLVDVPTEVKLCLVDLKSDDYDTDPNVVTNSKEGTFEVESLGAITQAFRVFPKLDPQFMCNMFLVPQSEPIKGTMVLSMQDSGKVFDEVEFTLDPSTMTDSNGNLIREFKAGHYYTITFKVHSPEQIFISVDVQDWIDGFEGGEQEIEIG